MNNQLNILLVSAECAPFAKTGGLGDVTGALPLFLQKLGHSVRIVMPMYSIIDRGNYGMSSVIEGMKVEMGYETITCNVIKTSLQGKVPVYLIDYGPFFNRPNIYHDNFFNDYSDNPKRFTFLSKAALQLCQEINFVPDIVHANDWHTAVLPAYVNRLRRTGPFFRETASVLTIHNIAYQGMYDHFFYTWAGLDEADFTADKFECYGAVNFLKGGIQYADIVNTVSSGYASETRTVTGGHGLDWYLRKKGDNYYGILNGVDYSQWDPETDTLIPANYTRDDLKGKNDCKRVMQKRLDLEVNSEIPVIGIISRLVWQKGFYILLECIEAILHNLKVQFAILGSGNNQLERFYGNLPVYFSGKAGAFIGYNNELAHLIEAGSDFFLMPSINEPCGLNQIYSMKYGTLPVVRATGGLNDTVENYNQETGEGTGFKFQEPSSRAIYGTIGWVLDTYNNRKSHLHLLQQSAMTKNFSWEKSAAAYSVLYGRALENMRRETAIPGNRPDAGQLVTS